MQKNEQNQNCFQSVEKMPSSRPHSNNTPSSPKTPLQPANIEKQPIKSPLLTRTHCPTPTSIPPVTSSISPKDHAGQTVPGATDAVAAFSRPIVLNYADGADRSANADRDAVTRDVDTDDAPPIAFLREASASVSPVGSPRLEMRRVGGWNDGAESKANTTRKIFVPNANIVLPAAPSTVKNNHPARQFSSQPSSATSAVATSSGFTFGELPIAAAGTRAPPGPGISLFSRSSQLNPDAHAQAPPARYTDSLIRRDHGHAFNARGYSEPRGPPARQRELEAALETTEAPIGRLPGPPALGLEGVAVMLTTMQGQRLGGNPAGRKQEKEKRRWQPELQPSSGLTAGYIARLEDAFGPGSALRGEGVKPGETLPRGQKRKRVAAAAGGKSQRSSASATTGRSYSVESEDRDTTSTMESRASAWIAEIEVLVKGKQQMRREDLESLARTMNEISNITAEEGRALGDHGMRLQQMLGRLAEEEIPFGDEYQLGKLARRLLKGWPKIS